MKLFTSLLVVLSMISNAAHAAEEPAKIYICIGQSNMVGRSALTKDDKEPFNRHRCGMAPLGLKQPIPSINIPQLKM